MRHNYVMTELLQKCLPYLALVLIYLAVASNFRVSAQPLLAQSSASLRSGLLALGSVSYTHLTLPTILLV